LHKIPDIRGSNYCLARAPRDKDGNTTLLPELADLSKDLTKASQQLSEGTIESKAGVDPLIMVMGPEHGGRTRGVGTNVGYKKGIKGYIRKKRTYQHRQEDYEEMEIRVLQKVKAVIKTTEFWEEMRVEMRRELESESNEGLSTGKDEVEFPRQSVASTTSIIKLSCIKEETYCCLYVPSSVSTHEKVTCATATVFPIGDGLIHGNKLLKGHMKVSVIKVVDFHKNMELPVPDDEFPTLLNAVKGFIQWPISAIARFKDEKRKAEYGKKLNELKHAITLHRPKSVLDGYNRWMSRGKDCVEPYNLRVDKEVFRQAEDSYFAINPTDIIELLTNKKLELGILTCFEMSLHQLNKVGFLHPEMITPDVYGADKGVTLDYLARALEGYEFYVAPYLQGAHYVLFIICPKHGRGFILDSQKESVFHTEDNYRLAGLVDSVLGGSLKWELPTVNRQPSTWECGYYVMRWMHDFVLKYQNDDFPNTIPWGEERRLENKELDAVIGAWLLITTFSARLLNGLFFMATSAKTAANVNGVFHEIGKSLPRAQPTQNPACMVLVNRPAEGARSASCCTPSFNQSSRGFGGVFRADVTDIQVVSNGFLSCGGDGTVKLGDTGMKGGFATRVAGYANLYNFPPGWLTKYFSQRFSNLSNEPGLLLVEFVFAIVWQLLDASLDDEGCTNDAYGRQIWTRYCFKPFSMETFQWRLFNGDK
ncbi:ulp1 protease family, C-terminal catalytic domain-containing protein, partial [Tanacetum coccineum]